ASLMRGCVALLAPSHVEGFGLPPYEAQALGVPVIASDIPAHREFAGDGVLLLDPLDGPAWVAALRAHMEGMEGALGHVAPRRAFSWSDHVARGLYAVRQVIARGTPLDRDS